jgi:hypothetical protein
MYSAVGIWKSVVACLDTSCWHMFVLSDTVEQKCDLSLHQMDFMNSNYEGRH